MSTTKIPANIPAIQDPFLVIGGNGKTGRRVADRLTCSGHSVRIGSRQSALPFDWNDRTTWPRAIDGTAGIYITYYPDLTVPGAVANLRALFSLALDAGVRKLVLLSGRGEQEALAAEKALQATDADWTIVRASWFFQNFSESFFLDPILDGEVALPVGNVREPFVDCEDIAEIAFAALTTPDHSRKLYEVTGPESLTFPEAIEEIARMTGRRIDFVPVTPEEYRKGMEQAGVPADFAELAIFLFTTLFDGRNSRLTDGVQQALGRPPRSFSEYVRKTVESGIWNPAD